jgi:methylmalonyl-CoA/ethylmalonyl-CoA epimerase
VTSRRVDHTAVAVRDLDEAIARFSILLGVEKIERRRVPEQGVEVVFLKLSDTCLELVTPLDESSGVARFLQAHGESLHHIGIEVDDLDGELTRLASAGVELIDHHPRQGVHGRMAFIHPRGTGGVLVELVEHDRA